jgi:hypothetical protein
VRLVQPTLRAPRSRRRVRIVPLLSCCDASWLSPMNVRPWVVALLWVWMARRHRRSPSDGAQPGGSTCRRGCRCLPRVGDGKNRAGDTRSRFSSMLPRVLISFLWATEVTADLPECCSGRSADRSWPMLIAPQLSCAPRYRDLSAIAGNGNPRHHLCRADQLRSPRATSRRTVGSLQSRISAATGSVPYARSNVKGLHHSIPSTWTNL